MIAVNNATDIKNIRKILCPECHGRVCDVVVLEQEVCRHKYRVIFDGNGDYLIAIKCQKCGKLVGLGIIK